MIDDNIIKITLAFATFASTIIAIIEKTMTSTSFFRNKDFRFLKIIDSSITNNISDKFKENFVRSDIDDYYFYLRTGIETNEKEKYIELKNKLDKNFTWWKIKEANDYIQSNSDDKLFVKLTLFNNIFYYITNVFIFIIASISSYLFFIIISLTNNLNLQYFILLIICLLCIMYLINICTPIRIAKNIKNRLSEISNGIN